MSEDFTASQHALSIMYKKKMTNELIGLQKYHKYVIMFWFPLCLAIIAMSSLWADIQGKKDDYTDPNQWQTCLTQADYQTLAVKTAVTASTTKFGTCLYTGIVTNACNTTCFGPVLTNCVSGLSSSSLTDVPLQTGRFLGGLSYLGIQTVIFSSAAHAAMYRALKHPSWLISTIALAFWFLFAIFTYYTVSPILPVPGQTNSTLLTYLYYESDYTKFDNYNNGVNGCLQAYRYVWVYLTFILLVALSVFLCGMIGVYAERIRYASKNKKQYEPLKHTEIPLILGALAIFFYLLLAGSKMTSSFVELNAIDNFDLTKATAVSQSKILWYPQIWFPFAQPNLDLSTILGITSFMSVLRGYTVQSVSAFRMAFIAAFTFAFSTYPGIVGAYEFYFYNNFQQFDQCYGFFLTSSVTSTFGYPDIDEAKQYCYSFRLALASSTGLFACMHFLAIACYFMYTQNNDRDSLVHEVIDFEAAIKELADEEAARKNGTNVIANAPPSVEENNKPTDASPVKKDSYMTNPMYN